MDKLKHILNKVREVCSKHFEELSINGEITIFSAEISTREIWAGNGDRDVNIYFVLTPDGWIAKTIETEIGLYQKGNGITNQRSEITTEEGIIKVLSGNLSFIREQELNTKCYELHDKYPQEFDLNDIGDR